MTGEIKSFNPVSGEPSIKAMRPKKSEFVEAAIWLLVVIVFLVAMLAR